MKVKTVVLSLSVLGTSTVFADQITPAQQAQLNQLQTQINQLSSQINEVSVNPQLGMTVNSVNRGVYTDYSQPFGILPDTSLSYVLLQQQADYKSLLNIGGYLEADAQYQGGTNMNSFVLPTGSSYNTTTALALTTAKLYFLGNVNDWTQAFMSVKGGLNGNSTSISEAFLTFGNLSKNPLYATIGKTYSPFGSFNNGNGPWSNSLLTNAFRSGEYTQGIFGFGQGGLNTSLAFFNGQNNISNFAYDISYTAVAGNFNYDLGSSYLNDMRYLSGSGIASAYATNGAAASSTSPLTGGKNPAFDLNAVIGYNLGNNQTISLAGEWATTTGTAIANGNPTGKMSAWEVNGVYGTPIMGKSTSFGLGYSATNNMSAVPLPLNGGITTATAETIPGIKSEWLTYASSEVLNNIYVGPEFARQSLYNGSFNWTGTVDLSIYF